MKEMLGSIPGYPLMITYSYHDTNDGQKSGWVVIMEISDEHGDILDTEEIAFYDTEKSARKCVALLNESELD